MSTSCARSISTAQDFFRVVKGRAVSLLTKTKPLMCLTFDRRSSTARAVAFNGTCRVFAVLAVAAATVIVAFCRLTIDQRSLNSSPRRSPVFMATVAMSRR